MWHYSTIGMNFFSTLLYQIDTSACCRIIRDSLSCNYNIIIIKWQWNTKPGLNLGSDISLSSASSLNIRKNKIILYDKLFYVVENIQFIVVLTSPTFSDLAFRRSTSRLTLGADICLDTFKLIIYSDKIVLINATPMIARLNIRYIYKQSSIY